MQSRNNLLSFEQAKSRIMNNEAPQVEYFNFDINQYDEKPGLTTRPSNSADYEYHTITKRTLIHIAIEHNNLPALIVLLEANAQLSIPKKINTITKQSIRLTGDGSSVFDSYSDYKVIDDSDTLCATRSLVTEHKNPLIKKLILNPGTINEIKAALNHQALEIAKEKEDSQNSEVQMQKRIQTQVEDKLYQDPMLNKVMAFHDNNHSMSLYGLPNKTMALKIEQKWQKDTIYRFFRLGKPMKKGKQAECIYTLIKTELKKPQMQPIPIDAFSRRSFIIALSKILSECGGMPDLIFQLGITSLEFKRNPSGTYRQKGNFELIIPTNNIAYGTGCIKRINFLLGKWQHDEREEVLLNLIQNRLSVMSPFTFNDFNEKGYIRLDDEYYADEDTENVENHIHFLNGLLFLITTVEVLVRLYRQKDGRIYPYKNSTGAVSDDFPVAMAQARSIKLLLYGEISFEEFLGETPNIAGYDATKHRAIFGAVTGRRTMNNLDVMAKKLRTINQEYNSAFPEGLKLNDFYNNYIQVNGDSCFIEGQTRMYHNLCDVYGAASESSSEGGHFYSDEESELSEMIYKAPI